MLPRVGKPWKNSWRKCELTRRSPPRIPRRFRSLGGRGQVPERRVRICKHPGKMLMTVGGGGSAISMDKLDARRVRNLRAKLPHLNGVVSYTDQHSFVTDTLGNGVGIAQVAELLGHTSTDIVIQHYQRLREKREYLKQAAIRAT